MRRLGKWLMLIGFAVPFFFTVFVMAHIFKTDAASQPNAMQAIEPRISRCMTVTMIGMPIGFLGAGLWLFAVVRDANRYRALKSDKSMV